MKHEPADEFDQQLRQWLEPDPRTVGCLTASAFANAKRRAVIRPAAVIVFGLVTLVGGGLAVRFGGVLPDVPGRGEATSTAQAAATTPLRTPQVAGTVTSTSDGNVLVIEWPDGSVWAGNVAAPCGVRPPAGTGRVVVEGSVP